jgi:uncharacterized protein (DUF488 family)
VVDDGIGITRLFTIGHSNRSAEAFLALLTEFRVQTVVDIRRFPHSRAFPHFERQNLESLLMREGMEYVWLASLGGLRRGLKGADSPNSGLSSPGFRNYADYMTTDEFVAGVRQLLEIAARSRSACMCAEAVYWRCHRRLLSDYLVAHGVEVTHIMAPYKLYPHRMTTGSLVTAEGLVIYPAQGPSGAHP